MAVIQGHVRLSGWQRLSYGLYQQTPATLADQLKAWQLVLPAEAAFTHLTAAAVRGWWLPAACPHPHFVAIQDADPRPRRTGLQVCRHTKPVAYSEVNGLRITSPAEAMLAACRDLSLLDLVILGDSALRTGDCSLSELKSTATHRRRGAPRLRQLLPLLDPRSESPWESVMRLLHQAAEIDVEPQRKLYDPAGHFLARVDLWIVGTRRIHEYDGEVHRLREQHVRDLDRERLLTQNNWQRFGYTAQRVLNGGIGIINDVDQALSREWKVRRLQAWNQLVADSLFGRVGRARAYQRWSAS